MVNSSWQERLDLLEALPTLPSVALRFIELGKDPEAEIDDYVQVARSDASLSSKLLAVANSAWIASRHEIKTVKHAVGLLGMNNVRALAVSYCLAGLHSSWKLDPDDAKPYWESSLSKAVAAKVLVHPTLPKRAEEAFAIGLFQDIGIGLFVATAGEEFADRLRDPAFAVADQLKDEVKRFGADHAECGRAVARRLKVPQVYIDAIAAHHDEQKLRQVLDNETIAAAVSAASLLPHDLRSWKQRDIRLLDEALKVHFSGQWRDLSAFIADVQEELSRLVAMLTHGTEEPPSLEELVREACTENARCTTALVGQLQSLVTDNRNLAQAISVMAEDQCVSEMRANQDRLTGLLSREGFLKLAESVMDRSKADGAPLAVAVFDLDHFKPINDTYGHACGDAVLKAVARRLQAGSRREDIICRWGGDEIIVVFAGLDEDDCIQAAQRLHGAVTSDPVGWQNVSVPVAMSGGLRWVPRLDPKTTLSQLIDEADQTLYEAKRSAKGNLICKTWVDIATEVSAEIAGSHRTGPNGSESGQTVCLETDSTCEGEMAP